MQARLAPQPSGPFGTHRVPPAREKDPDLLVAVPRIRARELAHDRQGRRIALLEPRLVAERRQNTAHARRLDRPRRRTYATRFLVLKEINDEPALVLSERIIGSSRSGAQVSATRTIRSFAMVLQSMAFGSLAIASP